MSDNDKKKVKELKKKHSDIRVPDRDVKINESFKQSLKDVIKENKS